jgi:hypothetical protein
MFSTPSPSFLLQFSKDPIGYHKVLPLQVLMRGQKELLLFPVEFLHGFFEKELDAHADAR